jgi:hypothetical protein
MKIMAPRPWFAMIRNVHGTILVLTAGPIAAARASRCIASSRRGLSSRERAPSRADEAVPHGTLSSCTGPAEGPGRPFTGPSGTV